MSSNVIDKFKDKKKKVLVTYAKILENIITLENNTLWQKASDFAPICEGVVSAFADKYYFDNNINRNNPVEYLNDNINAVLLSIIEYYKSINKPDVVKANKNETFLISVIVCTASYVDIASNVIDGDYLAMKKNFQKLLKHLNQMEILKIYVNNKMILDKLFKEVKKNINLEKKFFNYYKSPAWHNEYQIVSTEPLYYKVKFIYKIEGLYKENPKLLIKYQKAYLKENLKISYDLLTILLMKEYIMNKEVNVYLVPTLEEMIGEELNMLDIPLIKNNIKVLAPLERYEAYSKIDNFDVVYFYRGDNEQEILSKRDIEVIVPKEYMKKESSNLEKYQELNIKLVEESIGSRITEDVICQIKEED